MTNFVLTAAESRASEIRQRTKRFKLVFVQCGAAFDVLREPILKKLGGTIISATELAGGAEVSSQSGIVIVDELENLADGGRSGSSLGNLRMKVNVLCDIGFEVCLFSRIPRVAFAPVPGSSILDDASLCCVPLLQGSEFPDENRVRPGFQLPTIGLGEPVELESLLFKCLRELGISVLTDLDYAVFEANHGGHFVRNLTPMMMEAVRGAGLVQVSEGDPSLVDIGPFWKFREAVADVIAEVVKPPADLASISSGLWQIERTIRKSLRDAAIAQLGPRWRKQLLNAAMSKSVLDRARSDVNVTAKSVAELRDPIEWLTLGELLEVVRSTTFDGIFWDNVAWTRFAQDIMPIRNRLYHMRLVKKGDSNTVGMWVNRIRSLGSLPGSKNSI